MSIWTQVFLVNIIVWFFFDLMLKTAGINTDRIIDNRGVKGWSLILWTLLTESSVPVWLIYLVIS